MAVKTKQGGSVSAAPSNAVSMNPDNFVQGGLMDDFDGTITRVRSCPWDYNGRIDHHVLAVAVTIEPDEGETYVQHYSAGDLEHFAPSQDGVNAVDLENGEGDALEGEYIIRVGKRDGLSSSSNWAEFLGKAAEAGFDKARMTASLTFLEGTRAHFNRIPQKKRSGIVTNLTGAAEGGERKRASDILVITEILEGAAPAKTAKVAGKTAAATTTTTAKSAPATTASNNGAGDLDETLAGLIVEALASAGDDGIAKAALGQIAMKGLPKELKAKGIKRIADVAFLEGRDEILFDPDTNTIILNG